MRNYVVATLTGGQTFDTHAKALAHYGEKTAIYKGVFKIIHSANGTVEGVNVCGNGFDIRSSQLKAVAKSVALNKLLPPPEAVFIARRKHSDDTLDYVAAISDPILIGQDINNLYYHVTDWDKVPAHYPLHDRMAWDPIDSDIIKGIEHTDHGVSLSIIDDSLFASIDRTTYQIAVCEDKDYMRDGNYSMKKMGLEYLEILQESQSVGWDGNDVLPLPEKDEVQFRDLEAKNVWLAPIKREDIHLHKPDYDQKVNIQSSLGEDDSAMTEQPKIK